MRAERTADAAFFDSHDIAHRQYRVPDVTVPDEDVLTDAVDWIAARIHEGRVVLIHCAKGRGRSATVLAAYLMDEQGMTFDEVDDLLTLKRPLVKLQDRHRQVLESWIARRREASPGDDADADAAMTAPGGVPPRGRGLARPAGLLVTTARPAGDDRWLRWARYACLPVAGAVRRQRGAASGPRSPQRTRPDSQPRPRQVPPPSR